MDADDLILDAAASSSAPSRGETSIVLSTGMQTVNRPVDKPVDKIEHVSTDDLRSIANCNASIRRAIMQAADELDALRRDRASAENAMTLATQQWPPQTGPPRRPFLTALVVFTHNGTRYAAVVSNEPANGRFDVDLTVFGIYYHAAFPMRAVPYSEAGVSATWCWPSDLPQVAVAPV